MKPLISEPLKERSGASRLHHRLLISSAAGRRLTESFCDGLGQNQYSLSAWMKRLLAFGTIAMVLASCSPNRKDAASSTSVKPSIQEVLAGSKTLDGTALEYPAGKAELRLYRVEIPVGGKIPLHKHPAPMMVYVQGVDSGSLRNTRVMSDGSEIKTVFKPGQAFLKGVDSPHYSENVGNKPTILWVTVASAEGMPTTEFIGK